jgi:hypothetical protein
MTTPERLIEHGTEFERELLASARLDAGKDGGRRRAVVAMAAVLSTTATAATTGATAGASVGGISAGVLVKWVGVAVVTVGVAGASVRVGSNLVSMRSAAPSTNGAPVRHGAGPSSLPVPNRDREQEATAATMSPASIATAMAAEMPLASTTTATPSAAKAETRPSSGPMSRPFARGDQRSSEPSDLGASVTDPDTSRNLPARSVPPDLEGEVATLGAARAALGGNDAPTALRALDAYDRAFPQGVLSDEAAVLRIEALAKRSDPNAAVLSERFVAGHPASPYAERLRAIMAHNR